jgi:glycerophosphoryl diester phosphodiesterase
MKIFKTVLVVGGSLAVSGIAILFCLPAKGGKARYFPDEILFAHRAFNPRYPPNTIEGIAYLLAHRAHAVEIDLRLTADEKIVLLHDNEVLHRLAGSENGANDFRYDDLARFSLPSQIGGDGGCRIPLLQTVFERFGDSLLFYLDIKDSRKKMADRLVRMVRRYGLERRVVVANADILFTSYVRLRYPDIPVALEGFNAGKEWAYPLFPRRLRPDFLSSFHQKTDERHVEWLAQHGLLSSKIVYGVTAATYEKNRMVGFKKIIVDFDTAVFK